ncbi:hypothetical protein [Falsihalocynthiibacter arcticus]|uniref:hypothetical protein n=1 Tax=Falsihalocynthiibacter arcticus TaxID=1579316 RepID=UPI003002A1D9
MVDRKSAPEGAQVAGFDLFGQKIEALRDRRGRPMFKKTKQNQDFVAVRAAAGWSQDMIAEALGCDPKTLRKNFSRELSGGQLMIEGLCLDVLLSRARAGHIPSVRRLQDKMEQVAPPAPKAKMAAPEKVEPKGKKETRIDAAAQPGEAYGTIYELMAKPPRPS